MFKVIASSVATVLALGATAFCAIGDINQQAQTWDLGLSSAVVVGGGLGTAGNLALLVGTGDQLAATGEGTTAMQGFGALLFQGARANAAGANVAVEQNTSASGLALTIDTGPFTDDIVYGPGQEQSIAAYGGPAQQYEGAEVHADQDLLKQPGGGGNAKAVNGAVFMMGQCASNACMDGGLHQGALIIAVEASEIEASCAGGASVTTAADAAIIQIQAANQPTGP